MFFLDCVIIIQVCAHVGQVLETWYWRVMKSIFLVFCLHCQDPMHGVIVGDDGGFSYLEANQIRPQDPLMKVLDLTLEGDRTISLIEQLVDLPWGKRGLRYTFGALVCGEGLAGECCGDCLAAFKANRGKMLVKHPLAKKRSAEDSSSNKVVPMEKWRATEGRKNGLPQEVTRRDLPDSNRQRGRQGKPPHIKNAGRTAGQARAGRG